MQASIFGAGAGIILISILGAVTAVGITEPDEGSCEELGYASESCFNFFIEVPKSAVRRISHDGGYFDISPKKAAGLIALGYTLVPDEGKPDYPKDAMYFVRQRKEQFPNLP